MMDFLTFAIVALAFIFLGLKFYKRFLLQKNSCTVADGCSSCKGCSSISNA